MGKFNGKHLTGLVGETVSRRGKNGKTILQSKPGKYKQTKGTRRAAGVFGQGISLACVIRKDLHFLIRDNYDGDMITRFNTPVNEVLRHCYDKETEKFTFETDSFERLTGTEFNLKSPLINSLWVSAQTVLEGNILKIQLPEIEVGKQLKFPLRANVCELNIAVAVIALAPGLHKSAMHQSIEISKDQQILPAQEFTFEIPDGCLCVTGIGLQYFSLHNQVKTAINSKTFNPAAVCGALVSPGSFVKPASQNTPHHGRASEWMDITKLKLG